MKIQYAAKVHPQYVEKKKKKSKIYYVVLFFFFFFLHTEFSYKGVFYIHTHIFIYIIKIYTHTHTFGEKLSLFSRMLQ